MSGILGFSGAMGKPPKPVSSPIKSRRRRDYSEPIPDEILLPVELWLDIFSRLSVKNIAKCRCVSRLWSSILRRQDFSDLFITVSSTQPRVLFALLYQNEWMFFSASHASDSRLNSSPLVPSYHMSFQNGKTSSYDDEICAPVRGLVCSKTRNPMIFNPSTGEHLSFPNATDKIDGMKTLLGYDPIDKLFKVLCVLEDLSCRISTLGTREVNFRMIECSIPHRPVRGEILIDGVLYYFGESTGFRFPEAPFVLVCFDVRLEKFIKFIFVELEFWYGVLVNYKGKLGVLWPGVCLTEDTKRFKLGILEDVDEVKWSEIIYMLPNNWKNIIANAWLHVVGMTDAGEIVLSTPYHKHPFYIVYYNVVKNTMVRFETQFKIKGNDARFSKAYTFTDHVENLWLIDSNP